MHLRLLQTGDRKMKLFTSLAPVTALLALGTLGACSSNRALSADVSDGVRKSLDQAGLKYVTVSQDREKGVVTLGGHVESESDKTLAESLTRPIAARQVIGVEIAVVPPGAEKEARTINSDLDTGIEKNLDAVLIQSKLHDQVKYNVKNAVVTLTGEVESSARRSMAEQVASGVPHVKQIVNTLQVRDEKAATGK